MTLEEFDKLSVALVESLSPPQREKLCVVMKEAQRDQHEREAKLRGVLRTTVIQLHKACVDYGDADGNSHMRLLDEVARIVTAILEGT